MENQEITKQFDIDREQIGNFFKTHAFKIPDFQRDYDWESENSTFLDDLEAAFKSKGGTEEYYIGTVISHKDDRGFHQIIDGQQRITSLFILIAAYWIHITKNGAPKKKQKGVEAYLEKVDTEEFKLTAEEMDDDVFVLSTTDPNGEQWIRELMKKCKVPTESVNQFNDKHQKALKKAINFFNNQEDAELIYRFLLKNVIITHVKALNFRQAYIVFERMNDRGKELTVPDKIKYILMSKHTSDITTFRQYSDAINKKWRLVSDVFNDEAKFTTYLIHYFVAFLTDFNWPDKGEEAVTWFKNYWNNEKREASDLLDDMYEKALLYEGYKNARDNSTPPGENEALKYKRSYFSPSITQHLPLLLASSELDPDEFDTVANYVLKLCFLMQVTRKSWQSIRAQKKHSITSFVQDVRKKDMKALEKNMIGLYRKICYQEGFSSTICAKDFFADNKRNDLRKFTILKIEELITNESGGLFIFQDEDKSEPEEKQKNAKRAPKSKTSSERITLEHIIAKNTEAKAIMKSVPPGWSEDKIKEFIGRFGNYVALGYTLNNKLSDKPTRDKVEPYKEQGLSTTARLMFKDNISTPTEGSNAETRVIEKYQYEVINLSFVEGFDEDDQPIFSEDWQKYFDKEKKKYIGPDGNELVGFFLEKQIAKREHIMLLVIQDWLGLNGKGHVKKSDSEDEDVVMVVDKTLFKHPQDDLYALSKK